MNRFLAIAAALLVAISAFGADDDKKGDVKGKVVLKETKTPLDYATVQLLNNKGKPTTVATLTDENGEFTLEGVPSGSYILKLSSVGALGQDVPFDLSTSSLDLGQLYMSRDAEVLKEVVVEGIKSQMRFELDRKVFQVDASALTGGLSASELLENIPSVEVDQDGEISLRGNSSVTVWINGKESGLTADNRAQILEQIPAETIERVEVITNPSAKYSPEGTAGIINIVLKKERKGGYFGSAEIGANTQGGANASFNINYNSSKWEAFAGIGERMNHSKSESSSWRDYTDGYFLNSEGKSRNHGNNLFLRLGATYHITESDEVSASGFGMFGHRYGHSQTLYSSSLPNQWTADDHFSRSLGDNRGGHAEIGYSHSWTDSHKLDFSASFNHFGGPNWNSYLQEETYRPGEGTDQNIYQEQTMNFGMNGVETKLDYTNQVRDWLKLEAGFNGNYSHENTPTNTLQGSSQSDMTVNPDLYNRFIYQNNISALYLTLGGKAGKFSFSAGLRGEAWDVRAKSLTFGEDQATAPVFKKNDFALFPSAFVSYALPNDNEVQINYTRRIRRPWGGQLNSFRDISDPTNISYGNPELLPQYSNSFELNYIKSWQSHILSFSGYLREASDIVNRISYIYDNVMYTSYANVSKQVNAGLELVAKNSFFNNKFDLTTTLNMHSNHMNAWQQQFNHDGHTVDISGDAQNSFAWSLRMMASVRLPWGINFQATGRYSSKHLTAQGSRAGGYMVNAGLRKNVGNWSFSLNCRDIFDSMEFKSTINGVNYVQKSLRKGFGQRLQLTIKYSFGNMKQKNRNGEGGMEGGGMENSGGYGGDMGGGME